MQAVAYEGYFEKERFYTAKGAIRLPEGKRVVVTIFDDLEKNDANREIIKANRKERNIGFLDGAPLPDSFFEPLAEEELELWGL